MLVKAVWEDQQSLAVLSKKIAEKSRNPVWSKFASARGVILETALRRIKSMLDKELVAQNVQMSRNMGHVPGRMKKLTKINKDANADEGLKELRRLPKPVQELAKQAKWEREQWAIIYGCSYNVGLYNSISQTYWTCRTCCPDSNDEFAICESCAIVCHAGHDLRRGNHGKVAEIICDCGNGWMHEISDELNSNHPWREGMSEHERGHCFFNQKIFRPSAEAVEKLRNDIHGSDAKGGTTSVVDDTGHTVDEDEADIVEEVLSNYPHKEFIKDMQLSLAKFWRSKRTRVPLACFQSFFDYQLQNQFSFWEFFVLMAYGDTRISFLPILATNKAVTEDDLMVASLFVSDKEGAQGMEFDALAGIISFNEGDHFNFTQFGEGIADALGIVGQKNFSPVMKAKQLMMLVHGPPQDFYIMNWPRAAKPDKLDAHPYVRMFKRLTANVWEKVMGLHLLIKLKRKSICQFTAILEGDFRGLPTRGFEQPLYR